MFKEKDTLEESKIDNFQESKENNDLHYTTSSYDNDYLKDCMDYDEEDYYSNYDEEYYDDEPRRKNKKNKRKSKTNKGKRSNNTKKDRYNNYDDKENREEKYNKRKDKSKEREEDTSFSLLKLPFKILALPLIILLSIIIYILKIISIATWLVSKVIIIGAIGVSSIHAYQIYIGQPKDYRIFAICIAGFILAILLPFIVKVLPKPLEGINNSLKDFVMDR